MKYAEKKIDKFIFFFYFYNILIIVLKRDI